MNKGEFRFWFVVSTLISLASFLWNVSVQSRKTELPTNPHPTHRYYDHPGPDAPPMLDV